MLRLQPARTPPLPVSLVLALFVPLVLAACSDDPVAATDASDDAALDVPASDGPGGPDVPTGDTSAEAGDLGVDAGPDLSDANDASAGDALAGLVAVFETRAPSVEALEGGGLAAGFVVAEEPDPPTPVATVGACVVTEVDPDGTLFPDVPTRDAGAITVALGAETFTLTPEDGADGPRYVSNAPDDRLEFFSAGLTVRFEAEGGADVPAFAGSVSAPAEPVVASPAWGSGTNGSHAIDDDLAVAWTPSNRGEAILSIVPIQVLPQPGIAEGNAITCTVPDDGSYTIPAAALDYLPGGVGFGPNVALTVIVAINSELEAGDATVTLNATASHTVVGAIR